MRKKEEYAIVLDFLPNGYPFDPRPIHQKTPIAQTLGTENFTILELVPKKGIFLQPFEEVYIGDQKREQIHHINGKITFDKLTHTARSELDHAVDRIVTRQAQRFVDFFNNAQPLSTRMHTIELLPGIGKKHMWEIIERRDEKPFTSFDDIKTRVKLLPEPQKIIVRRIVSEIQGKEKHKVFVD
jgi:putative nucleotide binding protein